MTLVELLMAVGLLMLVFGGLFSSFQIITTLIGSSKAQSGALALANEKIEYIRSLPYDDVGTLNGIPHGPIPQTSTTTLNGVLYSERVLIEYIDAPADGEGAGDTNGILADYKLVKVEYTWTERGNTKTISLISNIVPRGIETTAGGGTLVVNVFDANVLPVAGAEVHVYNNSGTTTIDTIRYTNANGIAMFAGAPARANYEITVTDVGYSTDQTYSASSSNPNPLTPHVAVLESEVSTMNFQIDVLSDLTVETVGTPTLGTFEDLFNSTTTISTSTNITVASGNARLSGAPGTYSALGILFSSPVTPATLTSWDTVLYQANAPSNTSILVRVYDVTGTTTPSLISDTVLPGNSAGFLPGHFSLKNLDTSVYQSLVLGATLVTSDSLVTPELSLWTVAYTLSQSYIASIPFSLTSSKTIGTTLAALPVYKYQQSFATDGTGDIKIADLEFDVYDVDILDASYDIKEACKTVPYSLSPGVDETLTLILFPASARSLRVHVTDASGAEIPNAEIELSRSGFSDTQTASSCGQAFFSSLSSAPDYVVDVQAYGYGDQSVTDVTVDGTESITIMLAEI